MKVLNPTCSEAVFRLGSKKFRIDTSTSTGIERFIEALETANDKTLEKYEYLDNEGGGADFDFIEGLIDLRLELGKEEFRRLRSVWEKLWWDWAVLVLGRKFHIVQGPEHLFSALLEEGTSASIVVLRREPGKPRGDLAHQVLDLYREFKEGKARRRKRDDDIPSTDEDEKLAKIGSLFQRWKRGEISKSEFRAEGLALLFLEERMLVLNPTCSEAIFRLGDEEFEVDTANGADLFEFLKRLKEMDEIGTYEAIDNVGGGAAFYAIELAINLKRTLGNKFDPELVNGIIDEAKMSDIVVVAEKEMILAKTPEHLFSLLMEHGRETEAFEVSEWDVDQKAKEILRLFRGWKEGKITKEEFRAKALALLLLEERMKIEVELKDPSSIRREGDKWVFEARDFEIDGFSEDDTPIFEHLYRLGWKPDNRMRERMFYLLPAEFVVEHEPRESWLQIFRDRLLNKSYRELGKFSGFLTLEEKRALLGEFVQRERRRESWSNALYDYDDVLKLAELFPEVFEFPPELEREVSEDLKKADDWSRRPMAYGYKTSYAEDFEKCLECLARLKELGLLPKEIEEQAKETVSKMIGVFGRRAKKSKNFGEVSRAALNLTEGETRARLIASMILEENRWKDG